MLTAQEIAQCHVPGVCCERWRNCPTSRTWVTAAAIGARWGNSRHWSSPRIEKDEVCKAKLWDTDVHHNRSTKCRPSAQLDTNLNFYFPQVVRQHTLGAVGYIIWVLFTIYSSFQRWTNFANWIVQLWHRDRASSTILRGWVTLRLNFMLKGYVSREYLWIVR